MSLARALLAELVAAMESDPTLSARVRAALGAAPSTVEELVPLRACSVPVRTLRGAIARGELRGAKVGRELRVRRADLAAWLADRAVRPRSPEERATKTTASTTAATRAIERARRDGSLRALRPH